MTSRLLLLSSCLVLASCAYTLEGTVQEITLKTPGAQNAMCYTYVDGVRYKIYPPQTIAISKSKKDLVIDCLAPGNRRRQLIVPPGGAETFPANLANGMIPGAAFDYASESMFKYPETIYIDFSEIPATSMPLPAHNNPDIPAPEEYNLEEFLPGQPRLNSDGSNISAPLMKKERGAATTEKTGYGSSYITEGSQADTKSAPKPLPAMNPANPPSKPATDAPAPLYPGQ